MVKSHLSGSWLPTATFVYPQFVFLDAAKQPVRTVTDVRVVQRNDFFAGGYYLTVLPVLDNEAFVVVYTNTSVTNLAMPYYNSPSVHALSMPSGPVLMQGQATTHMIRAVPQGRMKVTLLR